MGRSSNGFDHFILQLLVAKPSTHYRLIVGYTFSFHPLAFSFLRSASCSSFCNTKIIFQSLLLSIYFRLNGQSHRFRKGDIAYKQLFQFQPPRFEITLNGIINPVLKLITLRRVQSNCVAIYCIVANLSATNWADNRVTIVCTNLLQNTRSFVCNYSIQHS